MNVMRLFSKMSGQRVATRSSSEVPLDSIIESGVRNSPDVATFASIDGKRLYALVWHYHDDDVAGPDAAVTLNLTGLGTASGVANVTHYRVDETHSNAYALWKRLGAPIAPDQSTYSQLLEAGQLDTIAGPSALQLNRGSGRITFDLPRQGVSLLVIDWGAK
jgi:xylan 1,4-beta-xylosidase